MFMGSLMVAMDGFHAVHTNDLKKLQTDTRGPEGG